MVISFGRMSEPLTMPSILSPFLMFLISFYKIKLYICLWNCYARFVCSLQKETNPEKYSHNITHNKERLQAQDLTVDVGLWCRKTSPQCCDERQRREMMSLPNIHFLPHTLFLFSPLNSDTVSYRQFKKASTNV